MKGLGSMMALQVLKPEDDIDDPDCCTAAGAVWSICAI